MNNFSRNWAMDVGRSYRLFSGKSEAATHDVCRGHDRFVDRW